MPLFSTKIENFPEKLKVEEHRCRSACHQMVGVFDCSGTVLGLEAKIFV